LLASPDVVTTTGPLVAPGGIGTTMLVGLQLVAVEGTPLNVTDPEVPKFNPVSVIGVPALPLVIRSLMIRG
jgi:hypothetical protein